MTYRRTVLRAVSMAAPALLLLVSVTLAQNTSTSMPGMPGMNAPAVISGKAHPELIPDDTAYRLYFLSIAEAPNPSAQRLARRKAFIGKLHVADKDSQSLTAILDTFKLKFTALTDAYNAQVDAAVKGGWNPPDGKAFSQESDALVEQTRDKLKRTLSPEGMAMLDAHVQAEKAQMTITTTGGAQ